jgi:hypothetical protein
MLPFGVIGPNGALGALAILVFAIGAGLLWRPGEPPILLLIFGYQWLQTSIQLFHGNWVGRDFADFANYDGAHDLAVLLLLIGVLALAVGLRLGAGRGIADLALRAGELVAGRPLSFWLRLYLLSWAASLALEVTAGFIPGLRQVILSLVGVKWAAFVLFTVATFAVPMRPRWPWWSIFSVELLLSIVDFFSSFRVVFIMGVLGLLFSGVRFRFRQLAPLGALCLFLIASMLAWTAVKGDFRDHLNRGTGQQVILVGHGDALRELGRLVGDLELVDYREAAELLLRRISYFEFFGAVLYEVPSNLPHESGALWGEAALRPFMPRLLFADKQPIEDSELTEHYTGLDVAGADEDTSISMGYMAEAYIDFGSIGMFIPILALGLVLGGLHRWLIVRRGDGAVYGAAISVFTLMPAQSLETSVLKLVPSLALSGITAWLLMRFVVPWLINRKKRGDAVRASES